MRLPAALDMDMDINDQKAWVVRRSRLRHVVLVG